MGCAMAPFFGPPPLGPVEGPKGEILLNIIKFQLQSHFQRFLNQTLCVYSQMKDTKHIRMIFIRPPGLSPRGGTWVYCGGWGVKFFPRNSTRVGV